MIVGIDWDGVIAIVLCTAGCSGLIGAMLGGLIVETHYRREAERKREQ